MNKNKCLICEKYSEIKDIEKDNIYGVVIKKEYICKYCGKYYIDITGEQLLKEVNCFSENFDKKYYTNNLQYNKEYLIKISNLKYKLQLYIRKRNDECNNIPELTEEKIKQIIDLPDKTIKEQFDLFIKKLFEFQRDKLIELTEYDVISLRIISWCKNLYILSKFFEKAYSENLLEKSAIHRDFEENNFIENIYLPEDFTFKGLEYLESLEQANQNSKKVFLAFKFSEDNKTIFTNLSDKIKKLELNPIIVNPTTTNHDEKIGDKIIAELKSSRILIADLTGHSQNVYYEIGYAMGMGIPVILTCHKEDIEKLHFDINQYPVFEWDSESKLQEKIKDRIKTIL